MILAYLELMHVAAKELAQSNDLTISRFGLIMMALVATLLTGTEGDIQAINDAIMGSTVSQKVLGLADKSVNIPGFGNKLFNVGGK